MPSYVAYRRGENYGKELKLQDSWRLPPLIEKLYVPNFSNCNLFYVVLIIYILVWKPIKK